MDCGLVNMGPLTAGRAGFEDGQTVCHISSVVCHPTTLCHLALSDHHLFQATVCVRRNTPDNRSHALTCFDQLYSNKHTFVSLSYRARVHWKGRTLCPPHSDYNSHRKHDRLLPCASLVDKYTPQDRHALNYFSQADLYLTPLPFYFFQQ